jgi:hypothetical protein
LAIIRPPTHNPPQEEPIATTLPADEAFALAIGARREEVLAWNRWLDTSPLVTSTKFIVRNYIRGRIKGFDKGEV